MKIILTSDLHGSYPEAVPECDLLIIAGDICHEGGPRDHNLIASKIKLEKKFVPWLKRQPAKDIVFIAGNHDYIFEEAPELLPEWPDNCHYLLDESLDINGLKLYGTPWVPNLPAWAFHNSSEQIADVRFSQIPNDTDILISHGPPFGILDQVNRGGFSVGCEQLKKHIFDRVLPEYVVFGHIHEAYGRKEVGGINFINASYNTVNYEPVNPVFEINL